MKAKYKKLKPIKSIKKEKPKNEKKFNYGLSILKSIMAFLVVVAHNFDRKSSNNKIIINITKERFLHVPSFFIMSFYFSCKNFISLNIKLFFIRLIRLLIPYVGWSFIIWIINHYLNIKYNKKFRDTYEDLKLQLMWGNRYIIQFWFLLDLIIMTIFFYFIVFFFRKHYLFILQIILILSYIGQYTGYVYDKIRFEFDKYYKINKLTMEFSFESIPYTITGFILGYYKLLDYIQKYKIKTLIISIIIYNIVVDYNIFTEAKGMSYHGIKYNIQSICLIFIFSLFPSDQIRNKYLSKLLMELTKYTGGVYYLHNNILIYLSDYFISMKKRTFQGAIISYLICYFISFVGALIFGKTPIKYLFY